MIWSGGSKYLVTMTDGGYEMVVDLEAQSYSKDAFLDCYKHIIEPICGETEWTPTEFPRPLPPAIKVPTGRPKKKRNKSTDVPQTNATKLTRKNTFMTCTYCK